MDDGFKESLLNTSDTENHKNGIEGEIMANFPEETSAANEEDKSGSFDNNILKINGGSAHSSDDADEDSETDALVIDESVVPKRKIKKRKLKNNNSVQECDESDVVLHSNPYFHESLFELSQQHHNFQSSDVSLVKPGGRSSKLKSAKPKLREYAQYLGLQPAVQFKCSKCRQAGFETLQNLNNHLVNCTADPAALVEVEDSSVSSFKLTRKVFLCSACGTYYENWNLYMHMLEIHRRYICLYCLGMFSVLDDLCKHIQNKHNWVPQQRDTPEDFFREYKEPCFIVCCECKKLFNEQDNFFYHNCSKNNNEANKTKTKQQILPENHITGDSFSEPVNNHTSPMMVRREEDTMETSEVLPDIPEKIALSETNLTEDLNTNNEDTLEEEKKNDLSDLSMDSISKEIIEQPSISTVSELNQNEMHDETTSNEQSASQNFVFETRKVPKLSLKLPKLNQIFDDSDDSDKLEMDQIESENEHNDNEKNAELEEVQIPVAGPEVNIVELELEQPLDKFDVKILLQKCLLATVPICVYCNHARKIFVNGKQLGLHAIAEHRYSAVVKSITAEELIPESFVSRIKESLDELDKIWFNLEANVSEEAVTFSHIFECFQCRYSTNIHKELYLHNRKMHTKNLLLCIMCKSNFYSYSELVCHLCPGDYILDYDVQFRCCMCVGDDLPSAFRLMVHLRKRHHVCDVCLEMCHNQYKLSNHVWKHKLHHFCYRCGIAYRNKQDITRHLFWKHGTESVLCKKCLQKKWPHVFHFCIPPSVFTCEECSLNFTKAVYLKVHKRIHSNDKPHPCTFQGCEESFVSKKLQQKHEKHHYEPPEEEKPVESKSKVEENPSENTETNVEVLEEKEDEKPKPKVDVYDLPELNLSESSDSETEERPKQSLTQNETKKTEEEEIIETLDERTLEVEQELANNITMQDDENKKQDTTESSEPALESIWDDFKIYQAKKEQIDHMFEPEKETNEETTTDPPAPETLTLEVALRDHDYFFDNETSHHDTNVITEVAPDLSQRVDHDYCTPKKIDEKPAENTLTTMMTTSNENKKNSSSSSSDSDSSSCSCGSNCSCSSSSSSSSSSDSSNSDSSTEEGRRRQQARREKRRTKVKSAKKENNNVDVNVVEKPILETPILETDLDTTESETDEEFYDKQPQKFARKLLEEKRNQILAEAGSLPIGNFFEASRNSTPSLPEEIKPKKKSKSKKRKKKKSERKEQEARMREKFPTVAPLTISLKSSPLTTPTVNSTPKIDIFSLKQDTDPNVRSSKRRRVPNKFYGYSSDEESEKTQQTPVKWRKIESPQIQHPPQQLVPPLTIKTASITPTVEPITIRTKPGELKVQQRHSISAPHPPPLRVPPLQINAASLSRTISEEQDSDSNESLSEEPQPSQHHSLLTTSRPEPTKNVQLYCYCRCPYDEVSEMIGCDSHDCTIEWFHFECVGIMVPPKGQWFCPDCRKRKQQRRELLPPV